MFIKQPVIPFHGSETINRGDLRLEKTYTVDGNKRIEWPRQEIHDGRTVRIVLSQGRMRIDINELVGDALIFEVDAIEHQMNGESRFNISRNSHKILFPKQVFEERGTIYGKHLAAFLASRLGMFCLMHEVGHVQSNQERGGNGRVVTPRPVLDAWSSAAQIETHVLRPERDASAFARRKIREWRKMGLDALPGVSDAELEILGMPELRGYMKYYNIPRADTGKNSAIVPSRVMPER